MARCRAHEGSTPSLLMLDGDSGGVLARCQTGYLQSDRPAELSRPVVGAGTR